MHPNETVGTVYLDTDSELTFPATDRKHVPESEYWKLIKKPEGKDRIFGRSALDADRSYQNLLTNDLPGKIAEYFRKNRDGILNKSREELVNLIRLGYQGDQRITNGVLSLFADVYRDEAIRQEYIDDYEKRYPAVAKMLQSLGVNPPLKISIDSPASLMSSFYLSSDFMPLDLYIKMLQSHESAFAARTDGIRQNLMEFRQSQLPGRITAFAQQYHLNADQLLARFSNQSSLFSIVFDETSYFGNQSQVRGGTNLSGIIILNPYWDYQRSLLPTYIHEEVHNLSGSGFIIRDLTDTTSQSPDEYFEDDEDESHQDLAIVLEKHGLKFYNHLNQFSEGLTDMITQDLYPEVPNFPKGYPGQIRLLENIMENGRLPIPKELFYQAYFESYDPALPPQDQYPIYKHLMGEISRSFSPGFLVRLDRFINLYDPKERPAAIKLINQNFAEVAQILMEPQPLESVAPKISEILSR